MVNLSPIKPMAPHKGTLMELRLVVWNTKRIPRDKVSKQVSHMVRVGFTARSGTYDSQDSDVHFNSKNGRGRCICVCILEAGFATQTLLWGNKE
ncbi:MAG: hypothetical protein KVP17_004853 [Porospora cf. gigantea B]|nr:MAG: hypothetical protein KVP17_004853 [Porospora cf. gigantea B]